MMLYKCDAFSISLDRTRRRTHYIHALIVANILQFLAFICEKGNLACSKRYSWARRMRWYSVLAWNSRILRYLLLTCRTLLSRLYEYKAKTHWKTSIHVCVVRRLETEGSAFHLQKARFSTPIFGVPGVLAIRQVKVPSFATEAGRKMLVLEIAKAVYHHHSTCNFVVRRTSLL